MFNPTPDDEARLREIDALIHDGKPSDDALFTALRGHLPRPRAEHTAQLERQLFAQSRGVAPMQPVSQRNRPAPVQVKASRSRAFPITATAAFAGTLLVVALLVAQVNRTNTPSAAQPGRETRTPLTMTTVPAGANALTMTPTPVPSATATATATWTHTPTPADVLPPTLAPGSTMGQGIIWPLSRLVAREGAQSLETGMRVAIYTRVQQFTSWTDSTPGLVREVLVTDNALVIDVLEGAGEVVIALPVEIEPIVTWLFSNDAYFTYDMAWE